MSCLLQFGNKDATERAGPASDENSFQIILLGISKVRDHSCDSGLWFWACPEGGHDVPAFRGLAVEEDD